jgi:hypothetical protein
MQGWLWTNVSLTRIISYFSKFHIFLLSKQNISSLKSERIFDEEHNNNKFDKIIINNNNIFYSNKIWNKSDDCLTRHLERGLKESNGKNVPFSHSHFITKKLFYLCLCFILVAKNKHFYCYCLVCVSLWCE